MSARAWRDRVRAVLVRRRTERELSDELEFHLAMQTKKHVEGGMDADEAAALAQREFGNVELVKEDARDVRGARGLEEFFQDVRYGLRSFARAPAFALSLVVTIGLGVGISWGRTTGIDRHLIEQTMDEGIIQFSLDYILPSGVSPEAINVAQLDSDLAALT